MNVFSENELKKLAMNIIDKSMRIGTKPNPHYERVKKEFPWIEKPFSLNQGIKKSKMSEKKFKQFIEKYSKPDYGPLFILRKGKYYPKKKVGEVILLKHHPESKDLALLIREQAWKKGAHVIMQEWSMKEERRLFETKPKESLNELNPVSKAINEKVDKIIILETRDWSAWSRGIPVSKMQESQVVTRRLHEISDSRKTPWLLVGWPFKISAKEKGISFKFLENTMREAILYSYTNDAVNLVKKYKKAFTGASDIKITADDGTNLSFSVKNRRVNTDTAFYDEERIKTGEVGMNVPSGEVFFAPVETSANGVIIFPKAVIPGEGIMKNLKLEFKKGVVKKIGGKHPEFLKRFIKRNGKDADRIAEFGIGLNKKSKFTKGEIIIDEKIFGSIHIAIGWNKGFGGKTNAASHLDFIKDLRYCNGKVFKNGELIINKGKLIFGKGRARK